MSLTDKARENVVANVTHMLEEHGYRADADLVQVTVSYVIDGSPANFIDAYDRRLMPGERYAVSIAVMAIVLALDPEKRHRMIRRRARRVQENLLKEVAHVG
jgi:hypothetical protein